jgi:hypothetical protein
LREAGLKQPIAGKRLFGDRRRLQEVVFLIVGLVTPVGVLVVNGSAYVMRHLPEFQYTLAVCAFVSNLSLQGLAVYVAIGHARQRWTPLYTEYRRIVVGAAAVGVLAWSLFGAYLTFISMRDPNRLPDLASVLVALFLILLPVVTVVGGRRLDKRKSRRTD